MDLEIVYGNFLGKRLVEKANYERNKNLFSDWSSAFLAFGLCSLLTAGCFYGYELEFGTPIMDYNAEQYAQAQETYKNLVKSVSMIKDVKSSGVDVNRVISCFSEGKNDNIRFTSISVNPKKYSLQAHAKDLASGDRFMKSLDFGKTKSVSLGKLDAKDGYIDFNISVAEKPFAVSKQTSALNKNGGKK